MKIAVYCSAKNTIPEEYKQLGAQLGQWIAEHRHTLIYGGATGGLMTETSNAVKAHGGKVIGVIPEGIIRAGRKAKNCDRLYVVKSMAMRKQLMRRKTDVIVCLPGSYGTLDEMFDVIASGTVGEHNKPIYILNYKGFYEGLKMQAQHMHSLHFLPEEEAYKPHFVDSMDQLINELTKL